MKPLLLQLDAKNILEDETKKLTNVIKDQFGIEFETWDDTSIHTHLVQLKQKFGQTFTENDFKDVLKGYIPYSSDGNSLDFETFYPKIKSGNPELKIRTQLYKDFGDEIGRLKNEDQYTVEKELKLISDMAFQLVNIRKAFGPLNPGKILGAPVKNQTEENRRVLSDQYQIQAVLQLISKSKFFGFRIGDPGDEDGLKKFFKPFDDIMNKLDDRLKQTQNIHLNTSSSLLDQEIQRNKDEIDQAFRRINSNREANIVSSIPNITKLRSLLEDKRVKMKILNNQLEIDFTEIYTDYRTGIPSNMKAKITVDPHKFDAL